MAAAAAAMAAGGGGWRAAYGPTALKMVSAKLAHPSRSSLD